MLIILKALDLLLKDLEFKIVKILFVWVVVSKVVLHFVALVQVFEVSSPQPFFLFYIFQKYFVCCIVVNLQNLEFRETFNIEITPNPIFFTFKIRPSCLQLCLWQNQVMIFLIQHAFSFCALNFIHEIVDHKS